jgi:hypothetical protein
MNKFLVVTSKVNTSDRERFYSYEEALEKATNQVETSFGRFTDFFIVEIKSIVRRKNRNQSHIEIKEWGC